MSNWAIKNKGLVILGIIGIILLISLFFTGFLDRTPTIEVEKGQKICFTDQRPNMNDTKILLCIPAAFSGEGGIIGHYSTGNGRKGNTNYGYTTIHLDNNTHFQQATLVKNHKIKFFTDNKRRFRRALCKKDGKYSIVHSKLPITLSDFSSKLTAYDIAWNLDMGTYSYGWYKDEKGLHHLGLSSIFNKNKQTNWIIIKKS